jgi:HlyD family secretion protein
MGLKSWIVLSLVVVFAALGSYYYWSVHIASQLPAYIASSNGRIEANQVNIATKLAGRITELYVREGDMVDKDQVLARLDSRQLAAQLKTVEAEERRLERAEEEAKSSVDRYKSQLELAEQMLERTRKLHAEGFATTEKLQQRNTEYQSAHAAYMSALSGVDQSVEAINAAKQEVRRVGSLLGDTIISSPIRGRVQYRLAEPGEVLPAGGNLLTLLDLADVYMTVFLPARDAGRLAIGSDARLVLDPVPDYVIPAKVSFVATQAQFTPRTVETADEREKLMFRVKISIDPSLLRKYESRVKAGVRGIAYVNLEVDGEWPETLQIKLPE